MTSLHLTAIGAVVLALSATPARAANPDLEARADRAAAELTPVAGQFAAAFHTPGVAIAVVTPGKVRTIVLGVREAGKPGRITPDTIFQLASVSKPITSTLAAALVSQGKLRWDTPIEKLLPDFTFASPAITHRTTLRDLLAQRSGLPGGTGDFLETIGYGEDRILHQMRDVQTGENFRRKWAYANFGITIGGVGAAAATGRKFGDAIREEIFRPVGMRTAFTSYQRLARTKNRARLHFTMGGISRPLFQRDAEPEAPGGGINASVRDLGAFLQLHLNDGRVAGRQLIDPAVLQATYQPLSDLGGGTSYGLCWNVRAGEDGRKTISHSGAFFAGSRTVVSFWPEEKIGIVVLSNNFPSLLPEALAEAFYQLYTKGSVEKKTLPKFQGLSDTFFNVDDDIERLTKATDLPATIDGVPLSAYAGTYRNAYAGEVTIELGRDRRTKAPTLFFHAGPRFAPVELRRLPGKSFLVATTTEGDGIACEFQKPAAGRFQELHLPDLKAIGWQKLTRVP